VTGADLFGHASTWAAVAVVTAALVLWSHAVDRGLDIFHSYAARLFGRRKD